MSASRERVQALLLAAGIVLVLVNLVLWAAGAAPMQVWMAVLASTLGNTYGLAQTLAKATPLLCTGTAVWIALRAGFFNVGAEGQAQLGVLAAAVVGAHLPTVGVASVWSPVVVLACGVAGGLLGAGTGWLRGRFGAHEVVVGLMCNGLVAALTTYLYGGPLRVGVQVHTAPLAESARVPRLDSLAMALRGSALSSALVVALVLPFLASWYLRSTAGGTQLRALGSAPEAARALGIDTQRATIRAMALSGALAGMCGVHYVMGAKGYAEEGMGAGVGFAGIAVAVLGRSGGLTIVLAAILLGLLSQGGLAVNALVPADVLLVAQSFLLVAASVLSMRSLRGRGR